jgi:hypothetical protein
MVKCFLVYVSCVVSFNAVFLFPFSPFKARSGFLDSLWDGFLHVWRFFPIRLFLVGRVFLYIGIITLSFGLLAMGRHHQSLIPSLELFFPRRSLRFNGA